VGRSRSGFLAATSACGGDRQAGGRIGVSKFCCHDSSDLSCRRVVVCVLGRCDRGKSVGVELLLYLV
jgi:hypothetical protein